MADGRLSALYGSTGSSNGLVSGAGGGASMPSGWRSADTLRGGGGLLIDDDSAVADGSELTAPANPVTPYSERPVARAQREKAHELIERLVAEGRVRITDPDDDEVTEGWRVVNYAKRHGLAPAGKRIEKVPYGGPRLELFPADGPHPHARSQRPKGNGIRFPFPRGWGTSIRSCRRSKTTSADTSCRLGSAEGRCCCCGDCQLRRSGEGTRCGRPTRSFTHARAEWTLLSSASHTPSVSGRSSRSPWIPTAPLASWWSSLMA